MRAGERKRELIYATAMELFRTKGFEDTTMRGIAERAGISLGSAYHYYASKAAIVFDYYSRLQAEHEAHVESLYDEAMEVEARLVAVTKLKLELARPDRKLLIEVATALVRPGDKLSAFSEENTDIRNRSIDVFARAIEAVPLTEEQRHAFASLIWVAHLGIFLYFVHDESH
ncbi:MAG: TetR/AcrR family transcriptional regulator, partial [Myxococcota bacterium]